MLNANILKLAVDMHLLFYLFILKKYFSTIVRVDLLVEEISVLFVMPLFYF